MTFLEVVAAVAILGIVTAGLSSAIGFVVKTQERDLRKLAAAEVAHRIILQYLDDPDVLERADRTMSYGYDEYNWEYHVYQLPLHPYREFERTRQTPVNQDDLRQIWVRVWLSERSGGTVLPDGGAPFASLTRLVNPVEFTRNPDTFESWISTDEGRRRLLDQFSGSGAPPPPGPPDAAGDSRSTGDSSERGRMQERPRGRDGRGGGG